MCTAPNIRCEVALRNALPVICARLVFAIFLGAIFVAGAPQLRAQSDDSQQSSQDVAGAARQERARKQNQETKHVYTNEDLRRGKILTPADQSRAAAKRKQPVAPTAKPDAEPLDADSNTPQEPLGDVARRYRNARRDTEKTSPFHLPSQQPELAAPKILAPLPKPLINPATKPSPKIFAPSSPSVPNTPGSFVPAPLRRHLGTVHHRPTGRHSLDPFSPAPRPRHALARAYGRQPGRRRSRPARSRHDANAPAENGHASIHGRFHYRAARRLPLQDCAYHLRPCLLLALHRPRQSYSLQSSPPLHRPASRPPGLLHALGKAVGLLQPRLARFLLTH